MKHNVEHNAAGHLRQNFLIISKLPVPSENQ